MTRRTSRPGRAPARLAAVTAVLITGSIGVTPIAGAAFDARTSMPDSPMHDVVPAPTSVTSKPSADQEITERTTIRADGAATEVAEYLAELLRPSTGYPLPVSEGRAAQGDIALRLTDNTGLPPEGYQLQVDGGTTTLRAETPAGLFRGVQTLRQLLPASIEEDTVQPGPWTVPGGQIVDRPRFEHRAAMLDVARHFFDVDQVKRYIDQVALYKINYLHLHLSDDQGWRLAIRSWPRLATYGGSTEVGGGPGGYYTQQDYAELVEYAESRHITIVPEIDTPGHTNAALASYAQLNCDGVAPPLYTGIEVGFSSLCVGKDVTYKFLDDVIREVAALTPGPYLHIGGDEADATSEEDYRTFLTTVLPLITKYGKTPLGWHDYVKGEPQPPAVLQFWGTTRSAPEVAAAAARGNKVLLSPANKSYLDMKYDENTELGLDWAGYTEVRDAYSWDPGNYLDGVGEDAVIGVEAPLFSETLEKSQHIERMAFPRLPAIAELGWSARSSHDWNRFRQRLAAQAPRWEALGMDYYRSPQVPWPEQ